MWLIRKGDSNYLHPLGWPSNGSPSKDSKGPEVWTSLQKQVSVCTNSAPAGAVLSDVAEHWDEDGVERKERYDVPKERDSLWNSGRRRSSWDFWRSLGEAWEFGCIDWRFIVQKVSKGTPDLCRAYKCWRISFMEGWNISCILDDYIMCCASISFYVE